MATTESILAIFLLISTVHIVALISPGPDFVLILRNSLYYSRAAAIWSAIGLGFGVIIHALYCILGFGLLMQELPIVFQVISILCAGYLFYLGGKAFIRGCSFDNPATPATVTSHNMHNVEQYLNPWKALLMGFTTNVLNPKAFAYFISFFAVVVASLDSVFLATLAGTLVVVLTWLWFILLSFLVSMNKPRNTLLRHARLFNFIIGIAFMGFAASILLHYFM